MRHIFERLPCSSPASASNVHFKHFCEVVWPRIKGSGAAGEPTIPKPLACSMQQTRELKRAARDPV